MNKHLPAQITLANSPADMQEHGSEHLTLKVNDLFSEPE